MLIFLTLFAVFAAILLILAVLIQPGKADMVSGMGGLGGQVSNLFGVREGRNILQYITMGLAILIALLAITINKFFIETEVATTAPVTVGQEIPVTSPAAAPAPAPAQPAQQQAAPQPAQQQPAQQQK